MATALSILQGFTNTYLQTLTDDQLSAALDAAWEEVDSTAYGTTANRAAANLAAHDLILENIANDANSGGSSGQVMNVLEQQDGDVRVKYGSTTSSTSSDPYSDASLELTFYGQRFKRLRAQVSFGAFNTGTFP